MSSASLTEHAPSGDDAPSGHTSHGGLVSLTVGAIGVVFGDIGTSPLYAFREALGQAASDGLVREEIVGVISLMLWALILIVTVKYVLFLMRADNEGEGGVLALLALASGKSARIGGTVLVLGSIGAALFYGDAIITPALSVLSAVEGMRSLHGVGSFFTEQRILMISLIILVGLFLVQSRGTASVAKLFGPVCIVWFIALGALGAMHIADGPGILAAALPWHGVMFVADHGVLGLFVLGAVFLTVTGAEALTADMGHFGKLPIRVGWFLLVFPALTLNYLGQGAFAIHSLELAEASGKVFTNQDWFFLMIPPTMRLPMVLLATAATIIASQAVITGAFSLTQQAIQLGLLPRLNIRQTSAGHSGQIYIGAVNWALLIGVVILALGFRNSSAMAAAYGIAVTGTMVVTCCLAYLVLRRRWGWGVPAALALVTPFFVIDSLFFGANILRVIEGGWVPLLVGLLVLIVILTWNRGRRYIAAMESDGAIPLADMARSLAARPPTRVDGVAIYLTARNDLTPHALLHNIKHNHVLHRHNYITTVKTLRRPTCDEADRLEIIPVDENFCRLVLRYGFMETPSVRDDLIAAGDRIPEAKKASFFIGRNNYAMSAEVGMPLWQDMLFLALYRNAADPTDYYRIPHNRVIELGAQYAI
ncbi:KUP system potassium uptake protein [Novosphingobium fluoreni]|uniref:Probable potassium transport system protein Kup n=1 Tax=Novosphingobium fluoreni TaxID=1391222 RepID=A0A7W6BWC7_9SPHN|nr:potassium transporter Kup [Novosphingobium fluoreni]MBB3939154.1 KUP system potassium uptake protein [Novosphingobium fluoreni]